MKPKSKVYTDEKSSSSLSNEDEQIKQTSRKRKPGVIKESTSKRAKLPEYIIKCRKILNTITSKNYKKINYIFLEPVDVEALKLDDYHDIIKNPMNLSTIRTKLNNMQYKNMNEFACDIRLMFENCYLYNGVDSQVGQMGKSLQKIFEDSFSKIADTKVDNATEVGYIESASSDETDVCDDDRDTYVISPNKILEKVNALEKNFEKISLNISECSEILNLQTQNIDILLHNIIQTNDSSDMLQHSKEMQNKVNQDQSENKSTNIQLVINTFEEQTAVSELLIHKPTLNASLETAQSISADLLNQSKAPAKLDIQLHPESTTTNIQCMSDEDINLMITQINNLSRKKLTRVLKLIKKHDPTTIIYNSDDIELEFKDMQTNTLRIVKSYLDSILG